MKQDTDRMRPDPERRPWVMTNLKTLDGLEAVVRFIEKRGMLQRSPSTRQTAA
jgi:urease accessory protein